MCIIYSLRECHYLKRTKIEVKLKIRIVHWVCSRSVLITMIFQYCAKLKPTKSLVHKKVDLCSPWAWVGWERRVHNHCTPPFYWPVHPNEWPPCYSYYCCYEQAKRESFFLIMLIKTRFRNKSGW